MRQGKLACLAAISCLANCSARLVKYAAVTEGRLPFFFLGLGMPLPPLLLPRAGVAVAADAVFLDGGGVAFCGAVLEASPLLVAVACGGRAAMRGVVVVVVRLLAVEMMLGSHVLRLPAATPRRTNARSISCVVMVG